MVFVLLDNKNWCKGIYYEGKLHFEEIPKTASKTWKYCSYLKDLNIEYASIYAQGKSIDSFCPDHLKEPWNNAKNKLKAFNSSFIEAKVSLEENCFFDLVPQQFLLELCSVKCEIIEHIFKTNKKPENYEFLLETEKLIDSISSKSLKLDLDWLNKQKHETRARVLLKKLKNINNHVNYNLYGSKTGRLTTTPNTFPILNLDTKYKSVIRPVNDLFVELDYNSAEARVLLGLAKIKQPIEDIHSWNAKRLNLTRQDAKTEFFAWLYGSSKIDSKKYEEIFKIDKILDSHYKNGEITNFYNRKICSDKFHSMNYLVQSTANDLFLRQVLKINKILKNKRTFISFVVHDSVVLDLAKEDAGLIKEIVSEFSKTDLGIFPVNLSAGKNYGNLRKIAC